MNTLTLAQHLKEARLLLADVDETLAKLRSALVTEKASANPDARRILLLEREVEDLSWERNRVKTYIEQLKAEEPRVRKEEARARIAQIEEEMNDLMETATEGKQALEEHGLAFLEAVQNAFGAVDKARALKAEAEYLIAEFDIDAQAPAIGVQLDENAVSSLADEIRAAAANRRFLRQQEMWERWRRLID